MPVTVDPALRVFARRRGLESQVNWIVDEANAQGASHNDVAGAIRRLFSVNGIPANYVDMEPAHTAFSERQPSYRRVPLSAMTGGPYQSFAESGDAEEKAVVRYFSEREPSLRKLGQTREKFLTAFRHARRTTLRLTASEFLGQPKPRVNRFADQGSSDQQIVAAWQANRDDYMRYGVTAQKLQAGFHAARKENPALTIAEYLNLND